MKIGIMSDSHDHVDKIKAAVEHFNREKCETVLHTGDFVSPFAVKALAGLSGKLIAVFGNNDGERMGIRKMFREGDEVHPSPYALQLAEKRFLLMHEFDRLADFVDCGHYDYIVYGHNHEKESIPGPPVVINPGECCGWVTGMCSVAILDTETNAVHFQEL